MWKKTRKRQFFILSLTPLTERLVRDAERAGNSFATLESALKFAATLSPGEYAVCTLTACRILLDWITNGGSLASLKKKLATQTMAILTVYPASTWPARAILPARARGLRAS